MKSRIFLKEIPSGKFHSAIFTTYSINLYYLEQQVLPLLGSKGIHYVSILADGAMLSNQLGQYGVLSQQRKRNYALHGIQSNGAFHPKLIFLAGTDSFLLLVGSGNLTTCGHGKNLEVWNAVYVNSVDNAKYGFVIQAWHYLKNLHADLGDSAKTKLKSIEENCSLLAHGKEVEASIFDLDGQNQISFHANQTNSSLFMQVADIIGNDKIERITIICPFHDSAGSFIKVINNHYNPRQIDVLIQADFGALPLKMKEQSNVRFFDWKDAIQEKQKQSYSHAKNIVLEGEKKNYLISGSANASLAAFGTMTIPATNDECCIVYQSRDTNYLELLSINAAGKQVNLADYKYEPEKAFSESTEQPRLVYIKAAEKNFDTVNLVLQVKNSFNNGNVQLFDTKGTVKFEELISLEPGEHFQQIGIPNGLKLLFVQISLQGNAISNKQFITDINAFESTNPSPRSRSLNQIRKLIESGNFSTAKIIDYLNTISRQKEAKKGLSKGGDHEQNQEEFPTEVEDDLLYLSYAEIQQKAKQIDKSRKTYHYIEYKGVRLWESIFAYLKDSRDKEIQAKIDEEETENINSSYGRSENKRPEKKHSISKTNFERLKDKVVKFLDGYLKILYQKTKDDKSDQPTLIDLSMYLIMLEILLHLAANNETLEGEDVRKNLIQIPLSKNEYSWSEYLIQYIGMFTMWCHKKNGFKDIESTDYRLKLEQYKLMAFKTNLCAIAIYNTMNKSYDPELQKQWLLLSLLNTNSIFNSTNTHFTDVEEFLSFIPRPVQNDLSEQIIEEEILDQLSQLHSLTIKDAKHAPGDLYYLSEIGYTYLGKVIQNPKNTFFKLFTPAFEWDKGINNYWNGYVYSIIDGNWIKSRK